MRVKALIPAAVAVAALAGPSFADASFSSEMKAAGKVERKVTKRHRGFNVTAICDQYKAGRYWCDFLGSKGDSLLSGKARVVNGKVRIIATDVL